MTIRNIFFCTVVLAALSVSTAGAQHYIGMRGGIGGGSARIEPKPDDKGTVWGLSHGGISWKYYSKEPYVGGVEADLLFMQYGFRSYDLSDVPPGSNEKAERESYYQRTVNTVTLPVYWQTYAYLFERRMRVFLNLGVSVSYNYSSKEETFSYLTNEKTSGTYDMQTTRDNPFTYGLAGGVGVSWSFDRFEILAEGRYYFGYGDIYRNRNRYELNPLRSPLDNMQISVGVYYRLGKGGILAPPSRKMAARVREAEAAQREKNLLRNPQRQIRQWDREYEKSMASESARLDKAMNARADKIMKEMKVFMDPWADGTYMEIPFDKIPKADIAR